MNVGGIAGSMAVEYDLDPEDDISRVGTQSLNFHYETRAILQSCVSDGAVTAKKDAAGGVVGRMDLGYLLACENYGPVESTNGDYVGGIAGTARSVLRSCWSKCALTGGKYVGGVAGYATELYNCTSLVLITSEENWTGGGSRRLGPDGQPQRQPLCAPGGAGRGGWHQLRRSGAAGVL